MPKQISRIEQPRDEVMTSSEVAQFLKVSIVAVRRWSRTGKLKGYRLGGQGDWRYLQKDVLSFFYNYNNRNDDGGR